MKHVFNTNELAVIGKCRSLLVKYSGIIRECKAQKLLFGSEQQYLQTIVKLTMHHNVVAGILLRTLK